MKRGWLVLMVVLTLALIWILPGSGIAAEKSLADILKDKGVLTEEEYQQAKQMEEAQKAEEAKKAEDAAKKAAAEKPAAPAEKPSGLPVAGYQKGFFLQSPDGKYKLNLTGYAQTQLRLFQANTSQDDQFMIRRARISLTGYYGKDWQGRVEGDFSTPSDGKFLKYAYLNCSYLQDAQVRVGQFKAPFSREYLTSSADIDTIERAMITDSGGLVPKYDIGAMVWGPQVFDGLLWYGVGVFNGNGANNSDTNDDKDAIGRVVLSPFVPTNVSFMKGLQFGGSMEYGIETPKQTFQPKLPTDWAFFRSVNYQGARNRYGADAAYTYGPFKLQGEWIYQKLERHKQVRVDPTTNQIVSSGGELINAPDLNSWGWYALGTYFLWGDASKGFQLVAQYEQQDVDDAKAADKYLKANPMGKSSVSNPWGNDLNLRGNTADVLTLGFNYFPHPNIRLAFNWYYETLDNKFTIDRIEKANDGSEIPTPNGHAMQAFWLMAQVRW